MRKKSIKLENEEEVKTPILKKDSVLNIIKNRLEIVEDRLTEIAYLLEYDFEALDDSSRTDMLEAKMKQQIQLRKQKEEEEIRRIKEQEDKRIEEAAQAMLEQKLKEQENTRKIEQAAADLILRQQKEKEEEDKRLKELAEQEALLKLAKEKEEVLAKEAEAAKKIAEAEKEKLEAKEVFDKKIEEEDKSIKQAKEKAELDPNENPYPKGSIEHVVWKRKQQAKKKR